MNRPIAIHPASLALGLVLAAVVFVSMAQTTVNTPARIEYLAHPRDYVQIREGTPYTVPPGKLFALTALGTAPNVSLIVSFAVNGQIEISAFPYVGSGGASTDTTTIKSIPSGFAATAGSVLDVSGGNAGPDARAWGYLVNQ